MSRRIVGWIISPSQSCTLNNFCLNFSLSKPVESLPPSFLAISTLNPLYTTPDALEPVFFQEIPITQSQLTIDTELLSPSFSATSHKSAEPK